MSRGKSRKRAAATGESEVIVRIVELDGELHCHPADVAALVEQLRRLAREQREVEFRLDAHPVGRRLMLARWHRRAIPLAG